jgi:hypothetical protein
VSLRRIKVEEEREARLEWQEERQSRMEELRIAGQKAQTDMMLKILEMLQSKKFEFSFDVNQTFYILLLF